MTYEEYEQLKKEINNYKHSYYILDDPLISDSEYEALLNKLKDIENEHPEWKPCGD